MFKMAREFSKNFMVNFVKIRLLNSFFFCFSQILIKLILTMGLGNSNRFSPGVRDRTFFIFGPCQLFWVLTCSLPLLLIYHQTFHLKPFCRCFKSVFRIFLVVRRPDWKMILKGVFTWRMVFTRMFTAAATNPCPMMTWELTSIKT